MKAPLRKTKLIPSTNWQVGFSQNLLFPTWALSLRKSGLEDKCGCTAQLSKAGASLQPTICYVWKMAWGPWPIATVVTQVQWEPLENSWGLWEWKWPRSVHYPVLPNPGGADSHCSASQRHPARERLVEWARLPGKSDIPRREEMLTLSCCFQKPCFSGYGQISEWCSPTFS